MSPLDSYYQQCLQGNIVQDKQQLQTLEDLQKIYHALLYENKKRSSFFYFCRKKQLVKGLYMWGSVGIGKTFLLDCFYQTLPFKNKMRMHFHAFMQYVHLQLKKYQGSKDPLHYIATELAKKVIVICFDELFVSDITDAMLLGRLFNLLFLKGVCVVVTSNVKPDDLYKDGLQRQQFLPAIALLKKNTHITYLSHEYDYRLRHLKEARFFYSPNDEIANMGMEKSFGAFTDEFSATYDPIYLFGRSIKVRKQAGRTIWFDFKSICEIPRSQEDYLAIAKNYDTVFISDIPIIPAHAKDQIVLFIRLVDIFYDARIRLVLSGAASIEKIYTAGHMIFEYSRTRSRLLEMQSETYFLNCRKRVACSS